MLSSSDQRKKETTNNAAIHISAPTTYTTLLAVATHIQHHPPITTPKQVTSTTFGQRILCSLLLHTAYIHVLQAQRPSPRSPPRRLTSHGQQEVDPELHLQHPSFTRTVQVRRRAQHASSSSLCLGGEFHLRRSRSAGRRRPAGGRWRGAVADAIVRLCLTLTHDAPSFSEGEEPPGNCVPGVAKGGTRPFI